MDKTFTFKISDYTLFSILSFVLIFISCSTHIEQEIKETTAQTETTLPVKHKVITVAAIDKITDEVYFDLIANTQNCLGEDLWLGGKLVSKDKVILSNSGAFSKTKVFTVTELTATGLSSNNTYLVNDKYNTLHAKYDEKGTIYLQLSDGEILLKAYPSAAPIVMAYRSNSADGYYDGSVGHWSCN